MPDNNYSVAFLESQRDLAPEHLPSKEIRADRNLGQVSTIRNIECNIYCAACGEFFTKILHRDPIGELVVCEHCRRPARITSLDSD